jgi:hypothetical protein
MQENKGMNITENVAGEVAAQNSDRTNELPAGGFDAFDLSRFRVPQEGFAEAGGEKILTTVRVGRPPKTSFFRVNPDSAYQMTAGIIEGDTYGEETYLVTGNLCDALMDESVFSLRLLVTAVTRSGTPFLWPLRLQSDNRWTQSAHQAAVFAKTKWIRLKSNREVGAYEIIAAINQAADPVWPGLSFNELMGLAFRDRIIESADHRVLRQLRGE